MSIEEVLAGVFPNLRGTDVRVVSPEDPQYNCVAWAVGKQDAWWWPDPDYSWPEQVVAECTLEAFEALFRLLGYSRAETEALEPGWEKVAVYCRTRCPTHVAKQLPSGRWASKLGSFVDIEHELAALEGNRYGQVALVVQRATHSNRPGAR